MEERERKRQRERGEGETETEAGEIEGKIKLASWIHHCYG